MSLVTLSVLSSLLLAAPEPTPFMRSLTLDGEVGPGYVFQNDGRYGPGGTRYTAGDVGEQRNLFIADRISVEGRVAERHTVTLLYAPLDLTTRVTLGSPIVFRGTTFLAGEVVDYRYLFDGYRASYLYRVLQSERFTWEIGASVQIRNASVEFQTVDAANARFAVESDIGTVFALKTRLWFGPWTSLWCLLDADAISSFGVFRTFSGGLYDLALSLGTPINRSMDVFLRLRWLGGGARVDNRSIDNWANFGFATVGIRWDLMKAPW